MQSFLESFSTHINPGKAKAWQKACSLGIPFESFQYVPLKQLYEKNIGTLPQDDYSEIDIDESIFPECKNSVLVFVNGIYSESLSNVEGLPSLLVIPMSDAEVQFEAFLKGRYDSLLSEEKDPFSLFNYAASKEGLFLYLPPKVQLKVPIQILNVYQDIPSLFSPRTVLFLGKESSCDIYSNEKYLNCQGNHGGWVNSAFDIVLDERASLNFCSLFGLAKQMVHTDSVRIQLKKDSSLKVLSLGAGKQILRQDFVICEHRNAKATLLGAFLLDQKLEAHIHTIVEHKEEGAYSLQKFKGILNGQSRMSFTGKIHVRKEAQQTQAYQLNNNLILSDLARAYSKPNLEIFADDVKASHGATIGKLNEEDLFYMKARGMPEKIARKLLVEGFYREVLQQIPLTSAKSYAQLSL